MVSGLDIGKKKCHQFPMEKFAILLNGDLVVTERLKKQIAGARIIAVDGGMRHARALEVTPEIWIGDFDSCDDAMQQDWPDVKRQTHPVDKDQTDGELAISFARENGAAVKNSEIILVGGLGGRTDQALSHVTQLIRLARDKICCFATSGNEEAWPLQVGSMRFDFPVGAALSVVGMSVLERLSITGVKWPLQAKDVEFASTLPMSNVVTGEVSIVLCGGCGVLLVKDIG